MQTSFFAARQWIYYLQICIFAAGYFIFCRMMFNYLQIYIFVTDILIFLFFFYWINYSQICVLPLTIALFAAWYSIVYKFYFCHWQFQYFSCNYIFAARCWICCEIYIFAAACCIDCAISSFVCKLHFLPHVNEYIIYRFAFLPLAISLFVAWCLIVHCLPHDV